MTFASANQLQAANVRLPLRISARDADSGSNALLTYRLLAQHSNASLPFAVDAQSGDVLLIRPLSPSQSHFGFFVEACDQPVGGRPLCSEPVGVTVYLADAEVPLKINVSCSSVATPEVRILLRIPPPFPVTGLRCDDLVGCVYVCIGPGGDWS